MQVKPHEVGTLRAYGSSSEQAQLASCTCISPPAARQQSRPPSDGEAGPQPHTTMPAAAHPSTGATAHMFHRGSNIPTATCAAPGQDKRGRHRFPCAKPCYWLATFPAGTTKAQATRQHEGTDSMHQLLGSKAVAFPSDMVFKSGLARQLHLQAAQL